MFKSDEEKCFERVITSIRENKISIINKNLEKPGFDSQKNILQQEEKRIKDIVDNFSPKNLDDIQQTQVFSPSIAQELYINSKDIRLFKAKYELAKREYDKAVKTFNDEHAKRIKEINKISYQYKEKFETAKKLAIQRGLINK